MRKAGQIAITGGKIILAFLMAFVLTLAAMVPVVAVIAIRPEGVAGTSFTLDRLLSDPTFVYGSMIAQAVGFIATVPVMYAWFERRQGWSVGWRKRGALGDFGKGAGIGIVLMTAIFILMTAGGAIRVDEVRADANVWGGMASYLLLFALVAFNEELFSRGYVQGLIRHRFGPAAAVICSSLFFASLHAFNPGALAQPLPLFNIFIAGILLGLCRELSGSLWLPIGLHWTWNYMQGNVFGFQVSGTPVQSPIHIEPVGGAIWSGGSFGAEGSLAATLVMLVAIGFIGRRAIRRKRPHPHLPE